MSKVNNKKRAQKTVAVFCAIALVLMVAWLWFVQSGRAKAEQAEVAAVQAITALLPADRTPMSDEATSAYLPAVEVEQVSYIGLLEIPDAGLVLPVQSGTKKAQEYTLLAQQGAFGAEQTFLTAHGDYGRMDAILALAGQESIAVTFTDMRGRVSGYTMSLVSNRQADLQAEGFANADLVVQIRVSGRYATFAAIRKAQTNE